MEFEYIWTDGDNKFFREFYEITEGFYNSLAGGEGNRRGFIPYNSSSVIEDVLIVLYGDTAVACSGLKKYSDSDVEIKRVWVDADFRGNHIASEMMHRLEEKAREQGYRRAVLQTREIMKEAVALYTSLGYSRIPNSPPYDRLDGAVCFAKEL